MHPGLYLIRSSPDTYPLHGCCYHLTTTVPELEYYLEEKPNRRYLTKIVRDYSSGNPVGWSKVIWDSNDRMAYRRPVVPVKHCSQPDSDRSVYLEFTILRGIL